MDQTVIKQIIKLCAIYVAAAKGEDAKAEIGSFMNHLRSYQPEISQRMADLALSDYSRRLSDREITVGQLTDEVLRNVKESMEYPDQIRFFIVLLDLAPHFEWFEKALPVENIAQQLGINRDDFHRYRHFMTLQDPSDVTSPDYLVFSSEKTDQTEKLEGRWVDDRIQQQPEDDKWLGIENFTGQLMAMYLKPVQSFIVRCLDNEWIEVDGTRLAECRFKIIGPGSHIQYNKKVILTYNDIKQRFIQQQTGRPLSLSLNSLQFKPSKTGKIIHALNAREHTGSLVGILGREGSGKTTVLRLLSGKVRPAGGNIEINGYDLQKNRYLLKDIIGYVPEEDLLYDELTVFDNLMMNARLYFSSLPGHEIREKVERLLSRLLLSDIRDKVVGNVLDKNIQPGQRRILNIALELLREPQLLLVDNALSGLSMTDSAKVISILHQYTLEGNLVITSITQVGSHVFNYFDSIWILDDGGYPVYTGPSRKMAAYLCRHLGIRGQQPEVIDPSTIIDLVNHQTQKENVAPQRVIAPQEWHRLYLASVRSDQTEASRKSVFPTRPIKIPNLETQFLIFSLRNFKCKFSRINNLIYALLSGPLIALILGFFLRHPQGSVAHFSANVNLPAYIFISVIVAMFMGIILSAEEIFKERNVIFKEQFLELSRFSYINSKIIYLLLIVALQSFLYTVIGNAMMGISGMLWQYWIVIYSVAGFGVLTGLLFSSMVKKLKSLYEILIPVFIALQILFGGGVISYHALNLEKTKYVPFIGELMVSRWGYEALAVTQFSGNHYQKNFLEADKNISRSNYYAFYLVPELAKMIGRCIEMDPGNDSIRELTRIIQDELTTIAGEPEVFPFEFLKVLGSEEINREILTETRDYLTYLELFFYERHETFLMQKNQLVEHLIDSMGQEGFERIKNHHYNSRLEKIVTNSDYGDQIELIGDRFIRFRDGIYQAPVSNYGRAVMFTPSKIFNGQEMNTLWFNISIIWMFSTLLYLLLLTDAVNYVLNRVFPSRS